MTRKSVASAIAIALASLSQTGCAMVGYSSGSGWFFWPGGWLGVLLMVAFAIGGLFFWRP